MTHYEETFPMECSHWKDNHMSAAEHLETKEITNEQEIIGCNPNITTFEKLNDAQINDSTVLLSTVYGVYFIVVVLFSTKSTIHSEMEANQPEHNRWQRHRLQFHVNLSCAHLGIAAITFVMAVLVFIGAIGLQTVAVKENNSTQYFWCCVYFFVSWCCFDGGFYVVTATEEDAPDNEPPPEHSDLAEHPEHQTFSSEHRRSFNRQRSEDRISHNRQSMLIPLEVYESVDCCRCYQCYQWCGNNCVQKCLQNRGVIFCVQILLYFKTHVLTADGYLFPLKLAALECFEVSWQVYSLLSSADTSDAQEVFISAVIISLNLILLPIVMLVSHKLSESKYFALAIILTVEILFDKLFTGVAVLLRPGTLTEVGLSLEDQLARHGGALLPAVGTAMDVRLFWIALSSIACY